MELLKDYDVTIQYHLGKANVVVDALSQKMVSMGSLACLAVSKQTLAKEIQTLESKFMKLGISEKGGVLASTTFIEEIKAKQFEDENFNELRKNTMPGKAQDVVLDAGANANSRMEVGKDSYGFRGWTSQDLGKLAKVYVIDIERLHGVPLYILSDR
ncbi:hypothetical protein MTR67_051599, partial [Solanum verrucosum]